MLHSIKGSIPLRLSGVSHVKIYDVTIENIINNSDFGNTLCG